MILQSDTVLSAPITGERTYEHPNPMNPADMTLLIGAVGAFFAVLGGGAKWLLSYIESRNKESADREQAARLALSSRLENEIAQLRREIAKGQAEKSLYIRRIYQLEYFIHRQPGIDIPAMEGWPPA